MNSEVRTKVENVLQQVGIDARIATEAARLHTELNSALDWCNERGHQWLKRELLLKQQLAQEQELHDEMAEYCRRKLREIRKFPQDWVDAAVQMPNPTPERCISWIEGHQVELESALPTPTVLQRQRRLVQTTTVRRSKPTFGLAGAITKEKEKDFRDSVTGVDLTPLQFASGYLQKKNKSGTYKWRFCSLNNEYFNYHKSSITFQQHKKPIGSYSLNTVQRVQVDGTRLVIWFHPEAIGDPSTLKCRKKFKAKSPAAATQWGQAIKQRMSWFKGLRNAEESFMVRKKRNTAKNGFLLFFDYLSCLYLNKIK